MTTTPDHDTDPSTPSSKRASDPRTAVAASVGVDEGGGHPVRSRPKTDPGVAPPPGTLPVPAQPMGIVVPSVAASKANDSVDMLLEGISREQPQRPRTTSQTEGQSAAAYHVEHALRAAQAFPVEEEPKVVIDQPVLGRTLRIARQQGVDAKVWTETTASSPQSLGPRVAIAIVAGLAVVMVIFVALQRTSPERTGTPAGAPATVLTAAPAPTPSATSSVENTTGLAVVPRETTPPVALPPVPSETPLTSAPPTAAALAVGQGPAAPQGSAVRRPAPAARPIRPKPTRPASSTSKASGGDLGEFKGSF